MGVPSTFEVPAVGATGITAANTAPDRLPQNYNCLPFTFNPTSQGGIAGIGSTYDIQSSRPTCLILHLNMHGSIPLLHSRILCDHEHHHT